MSEQISHFDRIVGKVPEPREELERELAERLLELGGNTIEGFEIEKMEHDKEIIRLAEQSVLSYLKRYGREKEVEIPLENIHLFREGGTDEFTDGRIAGGAHSAELGRIIIDRSPSDIDFALRAFHEFTHLHSYKALQVTTEEKLAPYRSGFSVISRDSKESYFDDIEEAIIKHMEARFYKDTIAHDGRFAHEVETMEKEGKMPDFGRPAERKKFEKLIDELWEHNQDTFENKDSIIDLFIKAQVTGSILPVGRIIEHTFGKGSFRKFGEETGKKHRENVV